jgi:UDP-MurNAc hydroxylase
MFIYQYYKLLVNLGSFIHKKSNYIYEQLEVRGLNIKWVNHASFILEQDDIKLISDPWMEGTVFDNGWALLAKTEFEYEDYKDITHIWFSHEHPDHFFPPNIKKIPEEYRKKITVLFKDTIDKKVYNFCKDLGFGEVIELKENEWYRLSDDFEILCTSFRHDSWICYRNRELTVLNTNDCEFSIESHMDPVVEKVGKVDLLLTQFSYAGSPATKESAEEKLRRLKLQAEVFQPTYLIPFASFVWFCHEENYYMNEHINKIEDVYHFIQQSTDAKPVIMYPGDEWKLFEKHSSIEAIDKYNVNYEKIKQSPDLIKSEVVSPDELKANYQKFIERLLNKNNHSALAFVKSCSVYLTDYDKAYQISVKNPVLEEVNLDYSNCDIALSSAAFNACMKFPWGWDTLNINGRFQAPENGDLKKFKKIGSIQLMNNHGRAFGIKRLGKEFVKKALGKETMI